MDVFLNIGFLIVSLLAGITVYFRNQSSLYLKLFPVFLLLSGIVQVIGIVWASAGTHNTALYNFNSVFEFSFFLFVLMEIVRRKPAKRILLVLLFLYPVMALVNIIYIQGPDNWNSMSYAVGSLLVVFFCVYYFLELFMLPQSTNLMQDPAFWICSGLLFFYCCSFPFFGLVNFMSNLPMLVLRNLRAILSYLNILLHLLFTIAFLARFRSLKKTVKPA